VCFLSFLICTSFAFGCGSGDNGSGADDNASPYVIKPFGAGDRSPEQPKPPSRAKVMASDTEAEVAARTSVTVMETYAVDHGGTYVGATVGALKTINPNLPAGLAVVTQPTGYSLTVTSKVSGTEFRVERAADGKLAFSCSAPGEGTCPADQDWGS
jgi:hypothetical protein